MLHKAVNTEKMEIRHMFIHGEPQKRDTLFSTNDLRQHNTTYGLN